MRRKLYGKRNLRRSLLFFLSFLTGRLSDLAFSPSQTSQSRFRGSSDEFQLPFLATHFVIERHREALLWSFFVARCDQDHDGTLTLGERQRMLVELGFRPEAADEPVPGYFPIRTTIAGNDALFARAGLVTPLATATSFDARDGFAFFFADDRDLYPKSTWPLRAASMGRDVVCTLNVTECLGPGFLTAASVSTNDAFRALAFERPKCGDCAILLLVEKSGERGLSAFLPDEEEPLSSASVIPTPVEPLDLSAKSYMDVDFARPPSGSMTARQRATRLLQRYTYQIGATSSSLISMRSEPLVINALSRLNVAPAFSTAFGRVPLPVGDHPVSFFTLNDDMASTRASNQVDRVLQKFFRLAWPDPSPYEFSPPPPPVSDVVA